MHIELHEIYQQDQADRTGHGLAQGAPERDRARRERVEELIATGALLAPEDYFHAAMVFQHGDQLEDYWRARELAKKGAELGDRRARWLAAAAYDRWLASQGKPQKYGTQVVNGALWMIDPATSDEERAEWNVKPLAELRPGEPSSLR